MIKFMKHFVTNGSIKAKVRYSTSFVDIHGKPCITIWAKSFDDGDNLGLIFGDAYRNDTDYQTDYFDKGSVTLYEDNPGYQFALAQAQETLRKQNVKRQWGI